YWATDRHLARLLQRDMFLDRLKHVCPMNKESVSHIRPAIEGLYNTVSKHARGYKPDEVIIDGRDLSENKILSPGILFRLYKVNFIYFDEDGRDPSLVTRLCSAT